MAAKFKEGKWRRFEGKEGKLWIDAYVKKAGKLGKCGEGARGRW